MSKRTNILHELPIEGHPEKKLRLFVYYALGGINYFTGRQEPRAYWLAATVVTSLGRGMEKHSPTDCARVFLQESKRFSQKTLDELQPTDAQIKSVTEKTLENHKIPPAAVTLPEAAAAG